MEIQVREIDGMHKWVLPIYARICPGPIADMLVRKAYVAGYDRRLRHPAWVRQL